MRSNACSILVWATLLVAAGARPAASQAQSPITDLRLAYQSQTAGEVEPCG